MDDGGRCLLDVINDPLLLQSFLEDKNEEVSKELSSLESVLLGRDEVSSTTSCLPARCELPDSMGYGCSGTDKPVAAALAVSATSTVAVSDVSAASPQLLVSSTVPPAPPPPAAPTAAASNGLPGASPHSTRSSPASSRSHSASPLPAAPTPVSWSSPGPIAVSRSQSLSSSSASTPATTKATATVAPLPVAPQQAPPSRPNAGQVSGSPSPRTAGAPRLIQPKQPQILPKLSSGSANMTTPAATATTRSQSPRAAQHKATPQPAPVPAPQPATAVQRGAAMGLNTGSPLLIGNPGAAQAGMFQAGPAQGTFLLNQYIPGLGQSPILIQGSLGQIQGSLGQIQGLQLSLRPPHATGLSLGPQAGHKPHGGHPGQPGTPTLVIPQNLGPRPNFILAPRMVSSPLQFAIAPGQPLTLQQLQAMLPAQTMLAQPTLGAFQTDQHQGLMQIPTFTQPQILAHDHHHHHHHHHHGALSAPLISTGGTMVSSAPSANLVAHHPVMTTTTVLHPAPPQPAPVPVSAAMTSATMQQQPQARTTASPAAEKVKAPSVNLAELLKEHGIMPESTPPPSPTSNQDSTISVDVPVTPAPVTENVQVVVSKSPQTVAVSPQQRVQLSLAHDGSVVLHPHGSNLSSMPAPVQSPGLVATTVTPTSTSAPGATALSRTHSALLERLSAAPPVSVPDLASLTAPRVSVSAPTMVAAPSLVAPSVMTPSMMAANTHPHQLTLHTVNNGLVPAQQLGQPQSFVTLHGTAVANMLCHGNNTRINHIVVSPSPSLGHQQQQQHHHHQHALHHTCHAVGNTAVVSSVASAVVPTTTTTAVMASSPTMVGRTAVPTSMPHTVVTVAACPTVTTVTVTPTVIVTTSNSSATAHTSGKCTAPMNSQNQQLYEQLQSQITYLNSLKKPTMQQKLLLQQMLSIEEKLRDSNKPQVSSSSNDTTTAAAVPTSHAHCMQRHEVKPTVVSHPMPAAATIITVKPSAVTTVQVPTITVATTTRTNSRTTHHKVNHADVKPKASILHAGNTASIIATQKAITSHSVPNQASSKFVPQLHHAVHHHHHHHHHLQPSPVASSVPPVNQRSPPQPRPQPVVVRLQHPTNHIIAPPSTTKQILVQVPSVVNKPPSSKSSGSSNSSSTKSTVPVLPSKVEPIVPKPPLPPPEQPPAPPPPPSKPVVVKPKVPDRVQKMHMFHQRLLEDQNGAMAADTKNPFTSRRDACQRLLRYHVYNSGLPREEDLHKTDEIFAEVSERLLGESRQLYQKFHYLMLKEGMRECSSAEKIMIEKLFLEHETDALIAEKRAAEEGQYTTTVEPPPLPPMPVSAWTFESSPSLPLPRPVKKEPPDSWLDDDDRSDLEPAPKRRSIKEEEHETVMAPMEEEPPSLPRVSVTPEHVDLVLSIHKELNMSPSETGEDDEFAHELADFEPPVARFPSTADLKQPQQPQFSSGGNVVPPVVVPDWTCGGKSADSEPRAPELDLSGIEGLDDDSSGVDPLGRTHYFGEDEEEDKDSVELHDQVQSAINSILDFRRAGADEGLCVDSKGAVARSGSGPEPMDYDDATGDTQPTDSVLDEAVRSILL
ncbi:mucin-2 isoform X2 [Dermacentor silvarum]|nr:mucin-2 isoform X2 [Dermacentor silvarum]